MPKITQQDALINALMARGYIKPSKQPSRKAVHMVWTSNAFPQPGMQVPTHLAGLWVGKMGSLRYGTNYTSSYPVSEKWRATLLKEGGYEP